MIDGVHKELVLFIIVKNAFDFVKHKNTNGKFLRELILFPIHVLYIERDLVNVQLFTFTNILVFVVSLLTIKGVKRKVQNQRRARPNIRTAYLDNESKT